MPFRLSELLVGLSGVADVGMGQPLGAATETGLVAVGLARALKLDDTTTSDILFTALLRHIGCTAYSYETSRLFGDDVSVSRAALHTDFGDTPDSMLRYLPQILRQTPSGARRQILVSVLRPPKSYLTDYAQAGTEIAETVARRIGLPPAVQMALRDGFETWDGRGHPRAVVGDDIPLAARVVAIAGCAAHFCRLNGIEAARRTVGRRSARLFDPQIAACFRTNAEPILGALSSDVSNVSRLLDAEPSPRWITDDGLVEVLRTFGDIVDLKSPYLHGHSVLVATLASEAGKYLRLSTEDVRDLQLAGYVHDLGRCAMPSSMWEHNGDLDVAHRQRLEMHAHYSEQILARSASLSYLAALAGMHHERLDGSGYHRRLTLPQIPMPARVLATADVFAAMSADRPYRKAYSRTEISLEMARMAKNDLLDQSAVNAVLAIADSPAANPAPTSSGFTDRQVEVLNLVAFGLSNAEIADKLTISRRSAENQVGSIYGRIGVASRAGAALFAMENSLLGVRSEVHSPRTPSTDLEL